MASIRQCNKILRFSHPYLKRPPYLRVRAVWSPLPNNRFLFVLLSYLHLPACKVTVGSTPSPGAFGQSNSVFHGQVTVIRGLVTALRPPTSVTQRQSQAAGGHACSVLHRADPDSRSGDWVPWQMGSTSHRPQ